MAGLVIIETHPIQYHAPVYREVQARFDIPVRVIYGSDFSVRGYRDDEFGATFAWDTDLLSGYHSTFLKRVSIADMLQALRRLQPDAVMLVGYRPRFHQVALISALLTRVPILFRGETTDHARQRGRWLSRTRDVALRALYARCSRLLYVGKRSYAHFRRLGCSAERLIFSPYCVDDTTFRSDEAARIELRASTRGALGIGSNHLVFLFSGKLVRRKGPDLLLAAIEQATDDLRRRSVAVFLGSGEEEDALREQAPSVERRFLGFKNQTELSAIYHASDVLVLPSRTSETWGLVVNEALQHGLPCVVSEDVGCAPDLVQSGNSGEVFTTGSAAALAQALQRVTRLVGDQLARECCRQHVAPYSVAAAANGIAQAYGH